MKWLFWLGVTTVALATTIAAAPQRRALSADATFPQILAEYRGGEPRRAVEVLAAWSDERVTSDMRMPGTVDDLASVGAMVLLLTESGMANRRFGEFEKGRGFVNLGGWGLEKAFEVHAYRANQLVEKLAERAKATHDTELMAWIRSWYILSSSYCLQFQLHCAQGLLDKGRYIVGEEEPEVLLWRGAMNEPPIRTRWRLDHEVADPRYGQASRWWYRKALDKDPMMVEARMRLGRSLHVTQNDPDATDILKRALTDALSVNHVFAAHLSALTLGEILEHEDKLDAAIPYYRKAVQIYRGHTASVALGQALVRSGYREEGWSLGQAMFGTMGPGPESLLDPWAVYWGAQYWQTASRITEMRKAVRTE
jgi:tetratricopeptide (TPR) repeat protein